jgi:hypothetical protein
MQFRVAVLEILRLAYIEPVPPGKLLYRTFRELASASGGTVGLGLYFSSAFNISPSSL